MTIPVVQIEGGYRHITSTNELLPCVNSPEDPPCYAITLMHPGYTDEDRAKYGLFLAVEFVMPEGHEATSAERFELIEGVVHQIFDTQEIPPPPVLTDREKADMLLAYFGLTVEQFKAVLEAAE